MSYYDHATLMAHRLGPWADDLTMDEARARSHRGLYAGRPRHASLAALTGQLCARMRERLRMRSRPVARTDGDAPHKT